MGTVYFLNCNCMCGRRNCLVCMNNTAPQPPPPGAGGAKFFPRACPSPDRTRRSGGASPYSLKFHGIKDFRKHNTLHVAAVKPAAAAAEETTASAATPAVLAVPEAPPVLAPEAPPMQVATSKAAGGKRKARVERKTNDGTLFKDLTSGAASGCVVSATLFPINTIKTRLMTGAKLMSAHTYRRLWRGALFDSIAQAAVTALFIGTYGQVQSSVTRLHSREHESRISSCLAILGPCLPSVCASLSTSTLAVPVEVIRQNVQASIYSSPLKALAGITKARGPGGLYCGYRYSLMRDLPFDTLQFSMYHVGKKTYAKAVGREELTVTETACLGGSTGALTGLLTTPIDVIKTHRVLLSSTTVGPTQSLNFSQTVSNLIRDKGVGTLFKGAGPRALEIALGGLIMFSVLEKTQQLLAKVLEQKDSTIEEGTGAV